MARKKNIADAARKAADAALAAMVRGKAPEIIHRLPRWWFETDIRPLTDKEYDWWHRQFRAGDAYKKSRGKGVVVAVLDTGCDLKHPDLSSQVLDARDFTGSPSGPDDLNFHGTHCAGVVSAVEDDRGIMGIAPDAKLLIAKVLGDDGSGSDSWIVKGIEWAAGKGAHVLSMSLGSQYPSPRIIAAIDKVIQSGVTVVMAAGNEGQMGVGYPAKGVPNGIRVAAVDKNFRIAPFSSRGPEVDIAGPGVEILSTVPKGKFARMSGTSMATPFVAGVCALAISGTKKKLSPAEVKARILKNAEDTGTPGKDASYGWGLIRPDMLEVDEPEPATPVIPPSGLVVGNWWIGPFATEEYEGLSVARKK